eukprot:TRINITY_DN7235_c0_g1_i1.p1 TRINITY_DN7235_c0_g1~~TRINITY_DN7235_c0_g1_i1.p1  ORF type:complete len:318 (-),score=48.07 TRINITY_DN7235_c0_g1_i1:77-1030(-)
MKSFLSLGKTGAYTIALTLSLSAQSIIITYSKQNTDTEHGYSYSTTTTILLAEALKFVIAAILLKAEGLPINFRLNRETLMYSLPAVIYFIQNNLVFVALNYVDAATYQVLVNLKIITTGILFRFVLQRYLSSLQWSALVLLMIGCATSQLSLSCDAESLFAVPPIGIAICVTLSVLSAAAGIATEWIMKNSSLKTDPLQRQNLHLYFFGIIFNGIGYIAERDPQRGFFDGYSPSTFLVVLSYTLTGFFVALIMKHADNMVKIYSVAVSMVLTMLISSAIFPDFEPTAQLFFGIVIITISLLMYFNIVSPEVPARLP